LLITFLHNIRDEKKGSNNTLLPKITPRYCRLRFMFITVFFYWAYFPIHKFSFSVFDCACIFHSAYYPNDLRNHRKKTTLNHCLHCNKMLAIFPSPAGISLTMPGRKYLNLSPPGRVCKVTSRLGTGKSVTFFTVDDSRTIHGKFKQQKNGLWKNNYKFNIWLIYQHFIHLI